MKDPGNDVIKTENGLEKVKDLMPVKCDWCQQRDALFELAIYKLEKTWEYENGITSSGRKDKIGRGDLYVQVKICEKCLPVTRVIEHQVVEPQSYRTVRKEKK